MCAQQLVATRSTHTYACRYAHRQTLNMETNRQGPYKQTDRHRKKERQRSKKIPQDSKTERQRCMQPTCSTRDIVVNSLCPGTTHCTHSTFKCRYFRLLSEAHGCCYSTAASCNLVRTFWHMQPGRQIDLKRADVHTDIERDRETERQRDRETERQRDRETERQRDRKTERQRNK